MSNIYDYVKLPVYLKDIYNVGDIVVRIGTTIIDSNEIVRGFREVGKVVEVKLIPFKNKYIYLYYVQFFDMNTQKNLYERPIAVFGHDLVRYSDAYAQEYYYNLAKQWVVYSKTIPGIIKSFPQIKVEYASVPSNNPLNNPSFGYDYSDITNSDEFRTEERKFRVGDKVQRKGKKYGNVAYMSYGIIVSLIPDAKLPNSNKEHNQICLVNFNKELEQVVIPASDLTLINKGRSKYVIIESGKNKIKISNKIAFILGQSSRIDRRVAEDLLDYGSFSSGINSIKVDKDNFAQIKKICKELIEI